MKRCNLSLIFIIVCIPLLGQSYRYFGVTDGLSDSRVLSIEEDHQGFIWFLTNSGVDRFDGRNVINYELLSDNHYHATHSGQYLLNIDRKGMIWVIKGQNILFRYHPIVDEFIEVHLPKEIHLTEFDFIKMTDYDDIWFINDKIIYIYQTTLDRLITLKKPQQDCVIKSFCQIDSISYYIGTKDGIWFTQLENDSLINSKQIITSDIINAPHAIYYHESTNKLLLGGENEGLLVYDLTSERIENQYPHLSNSPITDFSSYRDDQLLISTYGSGVLLYDLREKQFKQKFVEDVNSPNDMNGNYIRALHIDDHQTIWMSVYPIGITIFDEYNSDFRWHKHSIGNKNSIGNDIVHYILEDSDGDIWYATNNGISIHNRQKNTWEHHFHSNNESGGFQKNNTFLSLYEIEPGKVWSGGYMNGVLKIEKHSHAIKSINSHGNSNLNSFITDKYIRDFFCDKEGLVWVGGHNYLGCANPKTNQFHSFHIESPITCIVEKDKNTLFLGTFKGLFSFDKEKKLIEQISLPFLQQRIRSMYVHSNGDLYIGSTYSGLFVLQQDGNSKVFTRNNCDLLSNTINNIIPLSKEKLLITTDNNVAVFNVVTETFMNWNREQGLIVTNFNPGSGIRTKDGQVIIGCNNGAIELEYVVSHPRKTKSKLLFDKIEINGHKYNPNDKDTEIITDENNGIQTVRLAHTHNSLGVRLSQINFKNSDKSFIQWRLIGKNESWLNSPINNWFEFRNLKPGEYILHIKEFSAKDKSLLGEKQLFIHVKSDFWGTLWGSVLLIVGLLIIVYLFIKFFVLLKEFRINKDKIYLFNKTMRRIHSLAGITNASLNEYLTEYNSTNDSNNVGIAKFNIDVIRNITFNFLSANREKKSPHFYVSLYKPSIIIDSHIENLQKIAYMYDQHIEFVPSHEESYVWINKRVFEQICCNIIYNIITHAKRKSTIYIDCQHQKKKYIIWFSNFDLTNKKKLLTFNVNNSFGHSSTISRELVVIRELIKLHKAKMEVAKYSSTEFVYRIKFPLDNSAYVKEKITNLSDKTIKISSKIPILNTTEERVEKQGHLLIIEKDPNLLLFLNNALQTEWNILTANDVDTSLDIIRKYSPDIIIFDYSNPTSEDEEFCKILKENFNTTQIPLILLTDELDNNPILSFSNDLADHYINKPFDVSIIRTLLSSIIKSKRLRNSPKFDMSNLMQYDVIRKFKVSKDPNEEFMDKALKIIKNRIEDPKFNIDALCSEMNMSRTKFYNKLKTVTNKNISEIIREEKLKKAAELLATGNLNVYEASEKLGFNDIKHFRELFKNRFGITPREFVAKLKEREN